jgi:hypothetical protein
MFVFFLFGLSVALSFAAWAFVCVIYIWPYLISKRPSEAVRFLICFHLFRFVGASFLIPGVAGSALPSEFAAPGAYGDLTATGLAWIAVALQNRTGGVTAVWIFNVWGTADLLFAFYRGLTVAGFEPGFLASTYFIPTVFVPFLICSHVMIFMLLARLEVRADVSINKHAAEL